MKMKGQLESAQPLKKHKIKSKKTELKKKKKEKLEGKKQAKSKKDNKTEPQLKATPEANNIAADAIVAINKTTAILDTIVASEDLDSSNLPTRQRASKRLEPMSQEEQLIATNHIIKRLLLNEMTQGAALRELRVSVLGIRQDAYTKLCGVSRKTLSEIENDKGNYTAEIINKVFKPFDLKVGLIPNSGQQLQSIMSH